MDGVHRIGGGDFRQHYEAAGRTLPEMSLSDVNLESELLTQYQLTAALLSSIIADEVTPPNQKAQVINACTSLLEKIGKLQNELYGSERVKRLELIFIKVLRLIPNPEEFLALYEKEVRALR